MSAKDTKKDDKRVGLVGNIFGYLVNIVLTLVIGLIVSIIIEWLGITFFWSEQGYRHAQDMYNTEIGYLRRDYNQSILKVKPFEVATELSTVFYKYGIKKTGIETLLKRLKARPSKYDPWWVKLARKVQDYLLSMVFVTQTYAIRLTIIILSLPLCTLFFAYAAVRGFNSRALRTWGGGRESGTKYHWGKYVFKAVFALPFVLYLAYPNAIHPSQILVPAAIVLSLMAYFIISNYKKYL